MRQGSWERKLWETSTKGHIENLIQANYGFEVSIFDKAKTLNKFGRNNNLDSGQECTVEEFLGGTQYEETYAADNTIDRIVSSSGSDTQPYVIEGHTKDANDDLIFSVQTGTLTGQTPVVLGTPLVRATRFYIGNTGVFGLEPTPLAGNISVYRSADTTVTSGVPQTPTAVNLYVTAGRSQSQKCSTSISSTDYLIVTEAEFSKTGGKGAGELDFGLSYRDVKNGGRFRPLGAEISLNSNQPSFFVAYNPPLVIPSNHDVRAVATASTTNLAGTAEFNGWLAKVI